LTVKASSTALIIAPIWDVGTSVYFSALPFASTHPQGVTVRFLGANLRTGIALPFIKEPWRVGFQAGLSYTSMFVPQKKFGYRYLVWPQYYPSIRRRFGGGGSLLWYVKFATLSDWFAVSLKDREIATGLGWIQPIGRGGSTINFNFDVSDLRFVSVGIKTIKSATKTYSFSVGWGI
ncbi:MAG: hypothetical protein AAB425_14385, partial [Bdellovibrionota bacterium]